MLWFNRPSVFTGFRNFFTGLSLLLFLAGCQVTPLYKLDSGSDIKINSISIEAADTRTEQVFRNHLEFLFYGGKNSTVEKKYLLKMAVTSSSSGILRETNTIIASAQVIKLTGSFKLQELDSGKIIYTSVRTASALHDRPKQEFSNQRAILDAEQRAAKSLAEIIRIEIAAKLGKQ